MEVCKTGGRKNSLLFCIVIIDQKILQSCGLRLLAADASDGTALAACGFLTLKAEHLIFHSDLSSPAIFGHAGSEKILFAAACCFLFRSVTIIKLTGVQCSCICNMAFFFLRTAFSSN